MKILSTTLLISFMAVFATTANAGSDGSEDRVVKQPKPRLANCKDCIDAGYRRGFAEAEAIALENTPAGSSSVTTPLSYRKPVYVQAPSTRPRIVQEPALQPAPRKLPSYVQRMQPKVQPTLPNMQPKRQDVERVQRIQQMAKHAGHGHHTHAQMIDCELTDSLNRSAAPVTTVVSTQKSYRPVAAAVRQPVRPQRVAVRQQRAPARKPAPLKRVANYKHNDHYHFTNAERAQCDSATHGRGVQHSPVKQQQAFKHGNHAHHSHSERADCALTDSLNRSGSVVRIVRKH